MTKRIPTEQELADQLAAKLGRKAGKPANGQGSKSTPPEVEWPQPIPASALKHAPGTPWILHGYLARGALTLFTALWKSGKTTLLAHLLRALEHGGDFCGHIAQPSRVLYVTEESEGRWATRRDAIGLADHVEFLVRPFAAKPDWLDWSLFLAHVGDLIQARKFDLVAFDPLSNLWPVANENEAPQIQAALMPLQKAIGEGCCGLLVHHNRKSDGEQATVARGSGAFAAFADTIVEMRRHNASDQTDRCRVLTAYGRDEDTPAELVIELTEDGYLPRGNRRETALAGIQNVLLALVPEDLPGASCQDLADDWPEDVPPRKGRLLEALKGGVDQGLWRRTGLGVRGDPHRFWRPQK